MPMPLDRPSSIVKPAGVEVDPLSLMMLAYCTLPALAKWSFNFFQFTEYAKFPTKSLQFGPLSPPPAHAPLAPCWITLPTTIARCTIGYACAEGAPQNFPRNEASLKLLE